MAQVAMIRAEFLINGLLLGRIGMFKPTVIRLSGGSDKRIRSFLI